MSDYKLLKPNQYNNKGILVEYDSGTIDPSDHRNRPFINEVNKLNEGAKIMAEPLTVFVVLQKWGIKNRNGRIYPKNILIRENEKYQQLIKEGRAIGEHNHPETSIISGDRVSHNITKTWWEGQTLMGEMEIIMSPGYINQGIISCQGDHVANLLRKGIMIGVSSRGVGSLKKIAGEDVVQEDFELICWDVVTSPSTPGSWIFDRKDSAAPFVESENKRKPLLEEGLDEFLID